MKLNVLVPIIILISLKQRVQGLSAHLMPRNCTEVRSDTVQEYVPLKEKYRSRNWLGIWQWKVRTNYYKATKLKSEIVSVCCHGYSTDINNSEYCAPVCRKGCGKNEECIKPELCECHAGYNMDLSSNECRPVCTNECVNADCIKPEVCACRHGFSVDLSEPNKNICSPVCNFCAANEYCVEPYVCKCIEGYKRLNGSIERIDSSDNGNVCKPVCERDCLNADCVEPNLCKCHVGYVNSNDAFTCEPKCSHRCKNGKCIAPEVCACNEGYKLKSGSNHVCEPDCTECTHGECVAPETCSCYDGYVNNQNSTTCQPYCKSNCSNGHCTSPGLCACDSGFKPVENETLGSICEPICSQCIHGICIAPEKCSCLNGFVESEVPGVCQPYCHSKCSNGKCTLPEVCTCDAGFESVENQTSCEPVCTKSCVKGNCTAPETCTCFDGYKLEEENSFTCEPICENKCVNGLCTAPNECTCDEGYEHRNSTEGDYRCLVICECETGYCSDTSSVCNACFDGYELTLVDNATVCQPHCESGCKNGQCVEPELCDCDEFYKTENDSNGISVCVHACGADCNHGICNVENATCSCSFGWNGKYCNEPHLCSIIISENQTIYSQLNEYENLTFPEETWTGPSCHSQCITELTNNSKCYYEPETMIICFLNIETQCNTYNVIHSKMYKERFSLSNTAVFAVTLLTLIAIGSIAAFFIFQKRKARGSVDIMKTINALDRRLQENRLLEDNSCGISL